MLVNHYHAQNYASIMWTTLMGRPLYFSVDTLFLFWFGRCNKQSRQCFIGYPNTSNFVKNTPLRVVFWTLFSMFGISRWNTVSRVWYRTYHSSFMVFHDIIPTLPLPADVIKPQMCNRVIISTPVCINIPQTTCFQLGNDLKIATQGEKMFSPYTGQVVTHSNTP